MVMTILDVALMNDGNTLVFMDRHDHAFKHGSVVGVKEAWNRRQRKERSGQYQHTKHAQYEFHFRSGR
jgi:hypothetical protein